MTEGKNSVSLSLNNWLGGFLSITFLVFLGGSSLLECVVLISACPKPLNNLRADVFEFDPLIVITSVPFTTYQVLAFTGTRRSTKFVYTLDFPSPFPYFTLLFVMTSWEVHWIVSNGRFNLADVEGVVDKWNSAVCWQVKFIVVPLLVDVLTCWMRNGLTHLGFNFLNVRKRLRFSLESRTFWVAERSGGTDRFLLACFAFLTLEEYRLWVVSRWRSSGGV